MSINKLIRLIPMLSKIGAESIPEGSLTTGDCRTLLLDFNELSSAGKAEISRLTAELEKAKALLVRCIPQIQGNTGEWMKLIQKVPLTAEAMKVAQSAFEEGMELLSEVKQFTGEDGNRKEEK